LPDYLKRIKDDLDLFSEEQAMITVSRKGLEKLVRSYESMEEKIHAGKEKEQGQDLEG
jgi:hypothetical protein